MDDSSKQGGEDHSTNPTSKKNDNCSNNSKGMMMNIVYKECLKNHAAALGAHSTDGLRRVYALFRGRPLSYARHAGATATSTAKRWTWVAPFILIICQIAITGPWEMMGDKLKVEEVAMTKNKKKEA
ncbi:Zinc-finger homeodomain protein 11 [Bienertia sinuspersici]